MTFAGTQHRGESGIKSHNVDDERWKLVQRIVASPGFQRATQLRAMLQYVAEFAILHQGDSLHEYDIAREVLGRRSDFDPASDNIVRVQASHLRRKLDQYFAAEGLSEPLILTIPKGSYVPHFQAVSPVAPVVQILPSATSSSVEPLPEDGRIFPKNPKGIRWRFAAFAALLTGIALALIWIVRVRPSPQPTPPTTGNLILRSLTQHGASVAIVLPDISLVEIQTILKTTVTIPEYTSSDFPNSLVESIKDPELRDALTYVGQKRATSAAEASIAEAFFNALKESGGNGVLRYARDLHVRDLGDGNLILIGSPRSNPWVSLFSNRTNFTYFEDASGHYFLNAHPMQGELSRYMCSYSSNRLEQRVSYVDLALLPNLTNSGFVLLINGADVEANEAAAHYLLNGRLPASVVASLSMNNLRGFELLLKGAHLDNEADSTFEIVSFRLMQD